MEFNKIESYPVTVIELNGNLEFENFKTARDFLMNEIDEHKAIIVLNIKKLEIIDSSGVGLLFQCLQRAKTYPGCELAFCNASQFTLNIIRNSGMQKYFKLFKSVEEAVAHYQSPPPESPPP
ncbi:MAG: STAS domain-containing protein [Leptospira sp.]|nr:STAS domain-containing protein [Leptospira sp.]